MDWKESSYDPPAEVKEMADEFLEFSNRTHEKMRADPGFNPIDTEIYGDGGIEAYEVIIQHLAEIVEDGASSPTITRILTEIIFAIERQQTSQEDFEDEQADLDGRSGVTAVLQRLSRSFRNTSL